MQEGNSTSFIAETRVWLDVQAPTVLERLTDITRMARRGTTEDDLGRSGICRGTGHLGKNSLAHVDRFGADRPNSSGPPCRPVKTPPGLYQFAVNCAESSIGF